MAPVKTSLLPVAADFDVLQNRVAVALAKRERLIKSWTASSSRPRQAPKSQEELDAEDADLFNPIPAGLGLGAPIPKEFLEGDLKRKEISSNNKLRQVLLGNRAGLQASKPRDGKEKTGSAKRGLQDGSSDEDLGRSALGKAKKSKNGSNHSTTNMSLKDGASITEVDQEIKSASQETVTHSPSHMFRLDIGPLSKAGNGVDASQEKPPVSKMKVLAAVKKKPLVDYGSDDESDYHDSEPISAVVQKNQSGESSAPTISNPPTNETIGMGKMAGDSSRPGTHTRPKSIITPSTNFVRVKQNKAEPGKNPLGGSTVHSKNTSSKSSSSYTSKSGASSTESEPSDMETAIPLSLTSDVVGRACLPTPDPIMSPAKAKKAKNRDRRARKKERGQQRKALASCITTGGAEKAVVASIDIAEKSLSASSGAARKVVIGSITGTEKSTNGPADGNVVAKKIKDRLLDANGN